MSINEDNETNPKIEYNFKPDIMLKEFFQNAMSREQIIDMTNAIANKKIPSNYNVKFGNTQSYDATGSEDKDFTIGDNLIIFSNPDISADDVDKEIKETPHN